MTPFQSLATALLIGLAIQSSVLAQGAPQGTIRNLTQFCRQKWGGDAGMVDYCLRNQVMDYKRVQGSDADSQVIQGCKGKWGNDYGMVQACIINNVKSSSARPVNVQVFDELRDTKAPPAIINGQRINTCSHGEVCFGQLVEAMGLSY